MKKSNVKAATLKRDVRPTVFAVVVFLIAVPALSRLVTGFFLNIDDDLFFTNNPHLRSLSLDNIRTIFTTFYGGNYHPVTTLIEAFEFSLFGLKASAFHAVSLMVHLLNGWLVYRLVSHFSDRFELRAFVTAVFLLHPLHIEPVAWITDKTDLYYTAFFVAALDCYVRYIKNGGPRLLVWTAACFLLSLGCKPAAIPLPFILWLLDYHFGRGLRKDVVFKLTLVLISVLFAYLTFTSLDAGEKLSSELMPDYSLFERFFVANYAFAYYIVSFFIPVGLSVLHLAPSELSLPYYLAPLFNLVLCYGVYRWRHVDRNVLTGMLFYVLTIGLLVQLVPSGYNIVAERYSYVPYIGIALAVGSIYVHLQTKGIRTGAANALMILFCSAMVLLSYSRAGEWKDLATINRSIASANPFSAYAQLSAGFQAYNAGQVDVARDLAVAAEELDPENPDVHFLKGQVQYQLNDKAGSLGSYQQAYRLGSKRRELSGILAVMYFESSKFDSAEVYFSKVIAADTARTPANFTNRALCRYNQEHWEAAVADYSQALEIDSTLGNARAERGVCLAKLGRKDEACADLRRAVAEGYVDYRKELEENCR
jgi:tetratricopeptide (TPR) repeat protein